MNLIQRVINICVVGVCLANPMVAVATKDANNNTVPTCIQDLYAAIITQSEAGITDKVQTWFMTTDLYKGQLAEYVALMKGQAAGITKKSDLYAQALLIADAQEYPGAVRLLKKRYEKAIADDKYTVLNPSDIQTTASVPPYVQLLYIAVSVQANASYFARFKGYFVNNAVYKARLAEQAALLMAKNAGVKKSSDVYSQALQIANIVDNPQAANWLGWKYNMAGSWGEYFDEETKEIAQAEARRKSEQTKYYGPSSGAIFLGTLACIAPLLYKSIP